MYPCTMYPPLHYVPLHYVPSLALCTLALCTLALCTLALRTLHYVPLHYVPLHYVPFTMYPCTMYPCTMYPCTMYPCTMYPCTMHPAGAKVESEMKAETEVEAGAEVKPETEITATTDVKEAGGAQGEQLSSAQAPAAAPAGGEGPPAQAAAVNAETEAGAGAGPATDAVKAEADAGAEPATAAVKAEAGDAAKGETGASAGPSATEPSWVRGQGGRGRAGGKHAGMDPIVPVESPDILKVCTRLMCAISARAWVHVWVHTCMVADISVRAWLGVCACVLDEVHAPGCQWPWPCSCLQSEGLVGLGQPGVPLPDGNRVFCTDALSEPLATGMHARLCSCCCCCWQPARSVSKSCQHALLSVMLLWVLVSARCVLGGLGFSHKAEDPSPPSTHRCVCTRAQCASMCSSVLSLGAAVCSHSVQQCALTRCSSVLSLGAAVCPHSVQQRVQSVHQCMQQCVCTQCSPGARSQWPVDPFLC